MLPILNPNAHGRETELMPLLAYLTEVGLEWADRDDELLAKLLALNLDRAK